MTPERSAERAEQLRLKGDEAPMRLTMAVAVVAGTLGAIYDREAPLWIMAAAGVGGGIAGWTAGLIRRRHYHRLARLLERSNGEGDCGSST